MYILWPVSNSCSSGIAGNINEGTIALGQAMLDCCVALPRGAMGLSAVCDCGIS